MLYLFFILLLTVLIARSLVFFIRIALIDPISILAIVILLNILHSAIRLNTKGESLWIIITTTESLNNCLLINLLILYTLILKVRRLIGLISIILVFTISHAFERLMSTNRIIVGDIVDFLICYCLVNLLLMLLDLVH